MNVHEARRTRHLVIRLDKGEALPGALVRALDEAEARSGFLTGVGSLESAELMHLDPARTHGKTRHIETPCELISLTGDVALLDGAAHVRLSALLSREGELGLETFGGQLVSARALSVELHVVAFDDLALLRVADERTGLPVLEARPASASALHPPAAAPSPSPTPPLASVGAIPLPGAPPAQHPSPPPAPEAPVMPPKPQRPHDDVEVYPEVGDAVLHFTFGQCTVVGTDGDRIRLRKDKDGGVLDVVVTKLRIEPPTIGPDGTRHFKLHRKN